MRCSISGGERVGRRRTVLLLILLAWAGQTLFAAQAQAQADEPPQRIEEIRIVGNRRIPESSILFYIQSKENDPYNEQQILRDFRNLLNTDFFSDARVLLEKGDTGYIVIFEVTERPLVRDIVYEGMKSFKESDVLEKFRDMKVGLSRDSAFDPAKLPKARQALRLLLEMNGRPLGTVETDVEPISSVSVKLVFRIDEGPKVRIGKISFEGNTVLSDGELRDALQLDKERGPVTMFKGYDKYIPDKLEYDLYTNLLAKYRERGYMMAKAGTPKVEIVEGPRGLLWGFRKTKQQYYITVPIEEGDQYRVGKFEVDGVQTFSQDVVKAGFGAREGEVLNYTKMKDSVDKLKELYSTLGFLDMDARPEINPHPDTKTVDITINVTEGKRYIVNQINFSGNTKTRDKVLRREFILQEKQDFNGDYLKYSIRRLNQLGFFDKIEEKDYDVIKRPQEGEVDVLVKVKERSQQSIGVTGGVSGISGGFFGVNYSTNNFRGRGDRIDVQLLAGTRSSNYTFSYTQPYFLDTRLAMGFSVFNQRYRIDTYSLFYGLVSPENNLTLYSQTSTGATVTGTYPLARWLRAGLSYSLQNIKIGDVSSVYGDLASNQLIYFAPGGDLASADNGLLRSEVTPSLVYNSKNAFFTATEGSQLSIEVPVAGGFFGGDFNLIRPFVEYQFFRPDRFLSHGRNSFAFRARFTHIIPFGTTGNGQPMAPPFFERLFTGGEFSLRGFDIRSVSPWAFTRSPGLDGAGNPILDPRTGMPLITEQLIPVGGDTAALFTGEYRMPLIGPLQASAFADVGTSTILRKGNLNLFGANTAIQLLDRTNDVWRMSTGIELLFNLPVINQPFRLIFAYNPLRLNTNVVYNGIPLPLREPTTNVKFTVGYNF
ncbi:MAG: outer membrane protein assembly factor BamA [Acidobacteriota bacterium]